MNESFFHVRSLGKNEWWSEAYSKQISGLVYWDKWKNRKTNIGQPTLKLGELL